jgi:hypothetical protein
MFNLNTEIPVYKNKIIPQGLNIFVPKYINNCMRISSEPLFSGIFISNMSVFKSGDEGGQENSSTMK